MTKKYHKLTLKDHKLHAESLMMGYGYDPHLSMGAVKPPVFQSSTFTFPSAEAGHACFAAAYGLQETGADEEESLAYTRIDNPNLSILEDRLRLFDGAENAVVFSSGMAAVTTAVLAFARPGQVVVHSEPLYGGTEHFFKNLLAQFGIKTLGFRAHESMEDLDVRIKEAASSGDIALLYTETPANPTNDLVDLGACAALAERLGQRQSFRPLLITDNTFLGPIWQHPLQHGVDLVLYSLTKYIGGHSDVIAGAVLGASDPIKTLKSYRTVLGNVPDVHTAWLLMRSLETVKVRMQASAEGARQTADFLKNHPKISKVSYLGFLEEGSRNKAVYDKQCLSPGSTFSFDVKGGRPAAFRFLNALELIRLAVSLGGTESLICHPGSTTHIAMPKALQERLGMTEGLVRLSVGLEHPDDLIADLKQALESV